MLVIAICVRNHRVAYRQPYLRIFLQESSISFLYKALTNDIKHTVRIPWDEILRTGVCGPGLQGRQRARWHPSRRQRRKTEQYPAIRRCHVCQSLLRWQRHVRVQNVCYNGLVSYCRNLWTLSHIQVATIIVLRFWSMMIEVCNKFGGAAGSFESKPRHHQHPPFLQMAQFLG